MTEDSSIEHLHIRINTGALQGQYLIQLQRLLDVLTLTFAGTETVTVEAYLNHKRFQNFYPADKHRFDFSNAKVETENWLIRSFLKDAIELTNTFLEECRAICALYRLHALAPATGEDFNRIFDEERKRFNRLGLPDKLKELSGEFEVSSPLESHILSINRARNCLVHRLGIVTDRDIDDTGELVITWRTTQFSATNPDGSQRIILDKPGMLVQEGWTIKVSILDQKKSFKLGDTIKLTYDELYNSVMTFFVFATSIVKSIEEYSAKLGIPNIQAQSAVD